MPSQEFSYRGPGEAGLEKDSPANLLEIVTDAAVHIRQQIILRNLYRNMAKGQIIIPYLLVYEFNFPPLDLV